jgi:hypothetical protein
VTPRYRIFRRMREAAYKNGVQQGRAEGFAEGYAQGQRQRPSPLGGLLRATGAIRPDQDARVVHDGEDPFLASDWHEMHPTPGRPTCSHGHTAGSPDHVCAEMPSDYAR